MKQKLAHLKPQDIVLVVKLLANSDKELRISDLSSELGISSSEISNAYYRLIKSKLIDPLDRKPLKKNVLEFLVHALKYLYPAELLAVSKGVPTAHSANPLKLKIRSSSRDQYVWPSSEGSVRGHSITPLYNSVPEACIKDSKLHEWLALCDAIRVGKARERKFAQKELETRLAS